MRGYTVRAMKPLLILAVTIALALPFHSSPVRAAAPALPLYSGTSEVTSIVGPPVAPVSAWRDLGTRRIVSQWYVQDATHFRVDFHVVQPVLEREDQVLVANRSSVVWYRPRFHRAARMPIDATTGPAVLAEFQGGSGLPHGGTTSDYLALYNNPAYGLHAQVVGQDTILGRQTDIMEIWPLSFSNNKPVGRARVWIDHATGLALRYQQLDLPSTAGIPAGYTYRVTSLTFGKGPTAQQLAYRPPVRVEDMSLDTTSTGVGSSGLDLQWQSSGPFFAVGTPADHAGHKYKEAGIGGGYEAPFGDLSQAEILFKRGNGYVYIQERMRVGGLPAALKAGTSHRAGKCTVWTGRYGDGLRRLALARGKVSLLAVSNALAQSDLIHYAARQICR